VQPGCRAPDGTAQAAQPDAARRRRFAHLPTNVSRIEHEDYFYLRPTALTSSRSAASWRSPALPRRLGAAWSGSGQPTSIPDTDTWREWADTPILQSIGEQRCKTAASTAGDRVRRHRQRRPVLFSTASCRHSLRRCTPSRASPIVTERHRHRAGYAGSRPGPALTSSSRRPPMPALQDTSASNAPRRGHSYGGSSRCSSLSTRRAGPLAALVGGVVVGPKERPTGTPWSGTSRLR